MISHIQTKSLKEKTDRIAFHLNGEAVAIAFFLFSLLIALAAAPAAAADIDLGGGSKLAIHGFLSQAYANSSGGVYMGIPGDGTTDYRNAALQFRYEYSPKDAFVIQFSSQQLGTSPMQPSLGDVMLNWIFYERQLFQGTSIKVGRFAVPLGIYNEVLHVGTVIPFYRPSFAFYGDGSWTSETVDGVGLYHMIPFGESWSLEADLYAGGWTYYQQYGPDVTAIRANNVVGAQLWLYTPIEGVRAGLGGYRATASNLPPPHAPGDKETDLNWYVSFDGRFDRFLFQAEYRWWKFGEDWTYTTYYGLAGVKLTKSLMINVQAEIADMDIPNFIDGIQMTRDYALGVRYAFRQNLIAKAEAHLQEGQMGDSPVPDYTADPVESNYYIVSLAVSF